MATPSGSRPYSTSTPKNSAITTPTPMIPSPRPPTSAAMTRSISHKSPATRTPASIHGHSHHMSTSSHPASTPLANPGLGDEVLNINSPAAAAMMISLGSHGLTPLPTGFEGLPALQDLSNIAAGHGSTLMNRNPEEDKARRLQEVVKLLRGQVTGRGIHREGIERLAQLAGFTHMWQDDTLAIAGTCVDLEITFESLEKDRVKDVILKIFSDESENHKGGASEIIKENLDSRSQTVVQEPWSDLKRFSQNLEYLGRMDHLSQNINCFEAIDGLFLAFRTIWEEERKRAPQSDMLDRLCQGSIGRPALDGNRLLGLTLQYWAEKRQSHDPGHQVAISDTMQLDSASPEADTYAGLTGSWMIKIDCEAGYPSLRVSKEWITDHVLEDAVMGGENLQAIGLGVQVAWIEPPPTLVPPTNDGNGSAMADEIPAEMKLTIQPEVRFKADLEPSVFVPLSVASSIMNQPGLSVELDESKIVALDQALRQEVLAPSVAGDSGAQAASHRWERSVRSVQSKAGPILHRHSYALYSTHQVWCYPLCSIAFDHPRYLAELLPTLRAYVMLWTLLRSIVPNRSSRENAINGSAVSGFASTDTGRTEASPRGRIVSKDNSDPRRLKLAALFQAQPKPRLDSSRNENGSLEPLPVDVSLSLTSSTPPKPRLDVVWPLPRLPGDPSIGGAKFACLCIEIGMNGEVVVPSVTGLPFANSANGLSAIARVVGLCEDLGLTVDWVMEKLLRSKT